VGDRDVLNAAPAARDVARFGQVFTPPAIVERMLALRRNAGRVLDPACGDGAFSSRIPGCVAIELDAAHCPPGALNIDFFSYPESEKFVGIIGNPPYVKARDILPKTALYFGSSLLDGHANLYLHFVEKCVRHLAPLGELILITPRDFLKATGAARLNTWLYDQGTITDFEDLGDAKVFAGATPNCAIWRFVRGDMSHRLRDGRRMALSGGQLMFTRGIYSLPLASVFAVKVGAVSGADEIFSEPEHANRRIRLLEDGADRADATHDPSRPTKARSPGWSSTRSACWRAVWHASTRTNWWKWGRRHHVSDAPRIYVNGKTRNAKPFFMHPCKDYDGAVLALFPHRAKLNPSQIDASDRHAQRRRLAELGFVCDGRYLFSQRSLEQALLPESFSEYAVKGLV
jgi:adenine-specific DNA-methyltransferase